MLKFADTLAREYEVGTLPADFYRHIVNALIVGQRKHCIELFSLMKDNSKLIFLTEFLDTTKGIELSCLKICIKSLLD